MFNVLWGKNLNQSSISNAQVKCAVGEEGRLSFRNAVAVLAIVFCLHSNNSPAVTDDNIPFKIPQQRADTALTLFAEQANLTLVFPFDQVKDITANRLVGNYPIDTAINILLQDTGLMPTFSNQLVLNIAIDDKGKSMNKNTRKTLLASMVGLFAAGGLSTAAAQETESARAQGVLDEIVVTAERRSADMQDVPISISAFSGDQLEQSGVTGTLDLEMVTPGLSFSTNGRLGLVFIRGIGASSLSGPAADPSASTYIDGVYQARFKGALVDLLDIERIEVLKGPQGTLYGRNSTGGAIKYVTQKPSMSFGGQLKAEVGNYNLKKISATVDTPLVEDTLLLRTSVMKKDRDGYQEVVNHSGDGNDREDLSVVRFTLQYLPSDDLDILIHAVAMNDDGDVDGSKHFVDPNSVLFSGAQIIDDPRKIASDFGHTEAPIRTRAMDMTIKWSLDWATLTSISGYNDHTADPLFTDVDRTDVFVFNQGRRSTPNSPALPGTHGDSQAYTQEVTLASVGEEKLSWTVGAFYLQEDAFSLTGGDVNLPAVQLFTSNRNIADTTAYATFADASYSLTENLRLNAGVRYSHESKELSFRFENNGVIGDFKTIDDSWSDWTPKIGMDYSFSDDVMIYFTVSEGFKSGGFTFAGGASVDPEFVTAYEAGIKSMLLDGRLRLNASAFDYDYEDLQVQGFNFETLTNTASNAAEAKIQGLEISASALLSESFQADIGLSWLDAEYEEYFKQVGAEIVDFSGNKLSQAPEFTANIGLAYSAEIDNAGSLTARLDYYYSTEKYYEESNSPIVVQDDYELINARISFVSQDEKWDMSVFGKNLTDELVQANGTTGGLWGQGFLGAFTPPRTYGFSLAYNF